ncbi:MAG: hypothetical protein ABIZ07_01435 [Dermatophilaceae bacterium]
MGEVPSSAGSAASGQGEQRSSASEGSPGVLDGLDGSAVLTSEQIAQIYQRDVAGQAKSLQIKNPPVVKVVRYVQPREFGQTLVACLNERGIPATVDPDGAGYSLGDVPKSQEGAANLAQFECFAMYPVHPQYRLPASSKEKVRYYEYLVNVQVPCLRKLGYMLDNVPSESVWIAHFSDPWDPENEIMSTAGRDGVKKAMAACPRADPATIIEHPPALK